MEDILNKKTLRLEDIPVMSFGKYMIETLRKYGDEEALVSKIVRIIGPRREKPLSRGFTNNTGADQPAHPRSLISAFLFAFWKVSYVNLLQAKFQFSS